MKKRQDKDKDKQVRQYKDKSKPEDKSKDMIRTGQDKTRKAHMQGYKTKGAVDRQRYTQTGLRNPNLTHRQRQALKP